jgi:hypothetical protein
LHSPQVLNAFESAHFLISQTVACASLTPASLHPVQLIISGVISGELYIVRHFSAVDFLSSSLLLIVAILASQVAQFNPQHEISFSMEVSFGFCICHIKYMKKHPRAALLEEYFFCELPLHEPGFLQYIIKVNNILQG